MRDSGPALAAAARLGDTGYVENGVAAAHSIVARGDDWVDVMIRAESGDGVIGDALVRMTVAEYEAWTGHTAA